MNLTVVSFWTGPPWKQHAEQLATDCNRLGLHHEIRQREDLGSWVVNCNQKPPFIRDMLEALARPVLWIDADAQLAELPKLLADPYEEFAVYAKPGGHTTKQVGRDAIELPAGWPIEELGCRWFQSGTIYLRPTEPTFKLLDEWCRLASERGSDFDQWLLQEAWNTIRPSTLWLPETYCAIRRGRVPDKPVILQLLASTKIKGIDRG